MAIEFNRDQSLPEALTAAYDGIWFIKPNGADKMKIFMIHKGELVSLDVIDAETLAQALLEKADENKVIKTTGDQNINGIKTFLDLPRASKDATDENELVRLSQILEMFSAFDPPKPPKDGEDGEPGKTPFIGANGNWWIGDEDTGTRAASEYQMVYDRDIIGLRNGQNDRFTISQKYKPGSLKVYLDGILLTKGNNEDYIELNPGEGENGATVNRIITTKNKLIFEFIPA